MGSLVYPTNLDPGPMSRRYLPELEIPWQHGDLIKATEHTSPLWHKMTQ
jgi:hypothetical protein